MRSPLNWYGGKRNMIKYLLPKVPKHTTYVEPFGGGGSLLFAKPPSEVEVYNDKDLLLYTFFKVVRDEPGELHRALSLTPYGRAEHAEARGWLATSTEREIRNFCRRNPVEAARRFYILCKQSFSGLPVYSGWSHGVVNTCMDGWLNFIHRDMGAVVSRLHMVQIECMDALTLIKKYDTIETFFYVDPPYYPEVRTGTRYRVDFGVDEHVLLLEILKELEGMVLLSGYHCKLYDRQLAGWFHEDHVVSNQAVGTSRSTGVLGEGALSGADKERTEILWWNSALERAVSQIDWVSQLEEVENG